MKESREELELNGVQAGDLIIETGESALERFVEITRMEIMLAAEKKALKEYAFDERALHGSDVLELYGCKISLSNTGNRLQYDKDPVIQERKRLIKTANSSSGKIYDNDGVEVERVPVTYGSEVIKLSF
jgi:hypothetical protein